MKIGTVTGMVHAEKAAGSLGSQRLVMVEQEGGTFVATDHAGAAVGDKVLFVAGPAAARVEQGVSTDAAVVAVLGREN